MLCLPYILCISAGMVSFCGYVCEYVSDCAVISLSNEDVYVYISAIYFMTFAA